MLTPKSKISLPKWGIVALVVVGIAVIGLVAALLLKPAATTVSNYEQCKQAGGTIRAEQPESCIFKGVTYVNDGQSSTRCLSCDKNGFVGLTEKDALAAAERANIPARVVERDGESLPADSSFVEGRANLYIKDGKVYKVTYEGDIRDQ